MSAEARITIDEANLTEGNVILRFSDGNIVLFHAQFLYDVREQNANVSLVQPGEED